MENTMVPRFGVSIDITPRGLPFAVVGGAGGSLGIWVEAPAYAVAVGALLVTFRVGVRVWRRRGI
ncbi:hypothetical protein ABZ354_26680 [Streptomyces sp. NPDC005925]|uniref:hypothetical protein n=1 Tax=Streptomyces sp. NPDC005925 TaxID=3157172 RepID=UPI0033FD7E16